MDDAATTGEWLPDDWEQGQRTRADPDTPVEQSFLLQLRDNPDDLAMRMVFADWLEERAHTEKAEVVRLLAEVPIEGSPGMTQLRLLGTTLDREWMAIVSRAPIDMCPTRNIQFRYQCPKSWEALQSTDDATVRFCNQCNKNVYFCSSEDEVRTRGKARDCVAFSSQLRRDQALTDYVNADDDREVLMGEIDEPPTNPTISTNELSEDEDTPAVY